MDGTLLYAIIIFHFQVENPQAVLFHLNKPYVSHNDFYYGRTKNFGFCVLILKQNKEKKKNTTNTYFIKIYFLKNIQAGYDKETEQSWFVGVFILRFSF